MKKTFEIRATYIDEETKKENEALKGDICYEVHLPVTAETMLDAVKEAQEILGDNYSINCCEVWYGDGYPRPIHR